MSSLEPELRVTILPPDGDLVGLWISASNGRFAGGCVAYASLNNLSEFVSRLAGFPRKPDQRESWSNIEDKNSSWGYASFDFYSYDSSGHAAVRVKLCVDTASDFREDEKDYVELELRFEPRAMDVFATQLIKALEDHKGIAVLQGLPSNTSGSGHYR